jgi:hypothetical protein
VKPAIISGTTSHLSAAKIGRRIKLLRGLNSLDEEGDGRRKIALKRKINSLEQDCQMLLGLIEKVREVNEESTLNIRL